MTMPRDSALADLQRAYAALQAQLDENRAERDAAMAREAALAEVLDVINRSQGDPGPVFDAILEKAHRLCGAVLGSLVTYDGTFFTRRTSHNYPDQFAAALRQPYRPGVRHQPLLLGDRFVEFNDLMADLERLEEEVSRGVTSHLGIRTYLLLPIRKGGGVISAAKQEVHPFSEKEIVLLESFAAQAVIAIKNARLISEQREALEQQTATAEILQVINASPGELGPVFDTMLDRAMRLCKAAFGELHTFDGEHFNSAAFLGVPAGYAEVRMRTPRASAPGSIGRRFLEGASILHITDLMAEKNYLSGNPDRRALVDVGGARTVLAVALRKDDALLGNILIYRQEVRPFADRQIALLQNFAAQAVIAMENARLIDELRERTAALAERNSEFGERIEQQSATIDVLKAMSDSPDDTQPVFDLIAPRSTHAPWPL